jgi:hypothetical protein
MTESDIREQAHQHNVLNLALGLLMVPLSALMWWISYWAIRVVAWIVLRGLAEIFQARWDVAGLSRYIALGGLALLVVEGVFMVRTAGGVRDYFSAHGDWIGMRSMGTIYYDRMAGMAYMLSHFLFLAPEATLRAVAMLRHRMPEDEQTARAAARLLGELAADRRWRPLDRSDEAAAGVLHALKLIWVRETDGLTEIRIPPASD